MGDHQAIVYVRVSTDEQGRSGLGLEAQQATTLAYCAREGLEVVEMVVEIASGKSTKRRPLLAAALDRLDAGDADRLVVAKLDRLARNVLDLLNVDVRGTANGWAVVLLDLALDTSTTMGRFIMQTMAAVGELERNMTADRTRVALAAAKARGTVLGAPRRISDATYARAAALRSEGLTLAAIADTLSLEGHMRADGSTAWSRGGVQSLLRSIERVTVSA